MHDLGYERPKDPFQGYLMGLGRLRCGRRDGWFCHNRLLISDGMEAHMSKTTNRIEDQGSSGFRITIKALGHSIAGCIE